MPCDGHCLKLRALRMSNGVFQRGCAIQLLAFSVAAGFLIFACAGLPRLSSFVVPSSEAFGSRSGCQSSSVVEQRTHKPLVAGSNPASGTILSSHCMRQIFLFLSKALIIVIGA